MAFPTPFTLRYSALLVLATSTLPTFDIPCLFQLNISILVRVIKEMTTLVQPMGEDNHIKQIRLDLKFAVSEIFLSVEGKKLKKREPIAVASSCEVFTSVPH